MRGPRDLNDIRAFVLAAKQGSFSAAATHLEQPASTVSRAITRLERELGATLFRRSVRGLSLTDEGKGYLTTCRKALEALEHASAGLQAGQKHPSGLVRMACAVTFARDILSPLLPKFFKAYPDIRLEVRPYASNWDNEADDGIDVLFKTRAPRDSQRRVKAYPAARRGIFASSAYVKRHGAPSNPDDLVKHAVTGAGVMRLTGKTGEVRPNLSFRVETTDPYVHLSFAQKGLGIAALPLYMARWPENQSVLVRVLEAWEPDPIILCALFTGRSEQTPRLHVLLQFLDGYIGTAQDPTVTRTTA